MTGQGPGPAVVVTGASSGIGREIARLAARDGRALLLTGRSADALETLRAEIETAGGSAAALAVDLQDRDAIDRIEQALDARGWYCDVLVNSAGFGVFGTVAGADAKTQLGLIDVNIRAVAELTMRFLPGMIARRRGGILNVGSITAFSPGPYMAAYCASKAFVKSFTAAMAAEVAGSGVTVTNLTPGIVRTAFFHRDPMERSRLIKLLPHGGVEITAEAGWSAFKAGRTMVVPRFIDRAVIAICWLTPNRLLAWGIAALQRAR